jgi:hypothetical protein
LLLTLSGSFHRVESSGHKLAFVQTVVADELFGFPVSRGTQLIGKFVTHYVRRGDHPLHEHADCLAEREKATFLNQALGFQLV